MFWKKIFNLHNSQEKIPPLNEKSPEYSTYYKVNPLWTCVNHKKLEEIYGNNPTIFRCIHLISECANSMKITSDNEKVHTYLNNNLGDIITNLLVYGNCFLHKDLFLLPMGKISILTTKNHKLIGYKQGQDTYSPHNILHLRYCSNPGNNLYSVSPIQISMKWVDICNYIQNYIGGMMQNGGKPSGILSHGPVLNEKDKSYFREQFKELYKNITHNGSVVVAEGRFDWQSIGIEPEKLHLLQHWQNATREITSCFGVPALLLGHMENATFSNYSHARKHLWEDVVIPLLLNLTEKLSEFFECKVTVNTQNIEIMNEKIWQENILTINEKRKLLGYLPIEGGDML
jgi:HK97 family phage portal protein